MNIVRAKATDADALTKIAWASKQFWNYPERWMKKWREELTLTGVWIEANTVYIGFISNKPIGFYALSITQNQCQLFHFWITPAHIGQGLGRTLFRHAVEQTKSLGYSEFWIESDPNAERFYLKMGAERKAVRKSMMDECERDLPLLLCRSV
ncbi:MAG: GCN5-related N-acetyltransferase [Verrucomicrobiales bacterium]|nr:GCN5-related N-acetyltransferase [Verrucomicrobiales bacterium]